MNTRFIRLNLRDGAIALCPLLALAVVRFWLGASSPASATAAPFDEPFTIEKLEHIEPILLTPSERGILLEIEHLHGLKTPDVFPRRVVKAGQDPVDLGSVPFETGSENESPDLQPPPDLVVTSIMGGRNPIAIVNGRAHRVGDKVEPGWTITAIVTGRVIVTHLDGRVVQFQIERDMP